MTSETGDADAHQPFKDHLRAELVGAAKRKNEKRARNERIVKGGILGVVVLFAVSAALVIHPQRSDASVLNVQRDGNTTTVALVDLRATPDQISKELKHNDIKARVTTVPVADPLAGDFVSVQSSTPSSSGSVVPVNPKNGAFETFKFESGMDLEINVGRKAKPGEIYSTVYNAFLPGGVLHCSGLIGKRLDQVSNQLNAHASQFQYLQILESGAVVQSTASDAASMYIAQVNARSSDKLNVFVSAEPKQATDQELAGC